MSSLNAKQREFSFCLAKLLTFAFKHNLDVIVAEVYRPPETAKIYAEKGIGIVKSVHTKKLAADLFRYKDGTVSWKVDDYEQLGKYWKTLHPDARWGGDFLDRRDAVHFSFEHNGVV